MDLDRRLDDGFADLVLVYPISAFLRLSVSASLR